MPDMESLYFVSIISSDPGVIIEETGGPDSDGELVRPSHDPSMHSCLRTPMLDSAELENSAISDARGWSRLPLLGHADIRHRATAEQKTANLN